MSSLFLQISTYPINLYNKYSPESFSIFDASTQELIINQFKTYWDENNKKITLKVSVKYCHF